MKQMSDHDHGSGAWGWINTVFHLHGHSHQRAALASDQAFAGSSCRQRMQGRPQKRGRTLRRIATMAQSLRAA